MHKNSGINAKSDTHTVMTLKEKPQRYTVTRTSEKRSRNPAPKQHAIHNIQQAPKQLTMRLDKSEPNKQIRSNIFKVLPSARIIYGLFFE